MGVPADAILTVNSGSSSVKFALFDTAGPMTRLWSGVFEGIGSAQARLVVRGDEAVEAQQTALRDHAAALAFILDHTEEQLRRQGVSLRAVGHRVVHGGPACDCPLPLDLPLEERLREIVPLAPLHLPHNLAGIAAVRAHRPRLLQVACFDTAFHQSLPPLAKMTGLPREYDARGVRRYGFHGLSYEYVVQMLRSSGEAAARGRTIIAHLGNGASMCAVQDGWSIETTMGFSTLGGLVMGTRCGDLDPGAVLYLMQHERLEADGIEELLYRRSGLLGTSGGLSGDMHELLASQARTEAQEAVDLFCYRARLHVGALTAALGGLDRLVFTGGIGANAPEIRARIGCGLEYLGVRLDGVRNRSGATEISPDWADVVVQVIPTDEELMIARHTRRIADTYDGAGAGI
ncbi:MULTISPECIES: acetate/propionate family kinase [Methylorubrum]|uniref:Acetate kinase n=2 Tax=Methylorubrum TaxID=2282523 RepID=C5B1T4_METEA|nr:MULTISPECIES: acetate/propionate family kinase [Methylorubrum]MBY0143567.1 acetate/propionate family kinase [Methylorubrum populi]ACS39718.1 putative acetate kinase, propionate kinase [Methylorubrum extorquens AM1]MBK3401236.1 acetate/propionate family kinase [Methylorubrum rhodesianum]MCP1542153.1 acetate kinase [Methylorubrum extorquens]MCP1590502.1 acetate kinase [Methylorubrum extorquens]